MDILVSGGQKLNGEIQPSGSKNSAVAILPATLLFSKPVTLRNIPEITDVERLINILKKLGSKISWNKKDSTIQIDNSQVSLEKLNHEDLGNMRGTSLLWGPMLARFGKVEFQDLPGGCTLGIRPLSPHYDAFKELGVEVKQSKRGVSLNAKEAKAQKILLKEMSPTVTENVVMLASALPGETTIVGAASKPQVQDLCLFLQKAGVKISGIGSSVLKISGGQKLKLVKHELLPDHYEIATFLALGAITGGEVSVKNAMPELFAPIANTFKKFGVDILYSGEMAKVKNQKPKISPNGGLGTLVVKAQPWPALPVDCLPLFIPLALASKKGSVLFHNWMYESGLFWTSELTKLGANVIMADPHRVIVQAGNPLYGATLEAPYIIRAVVAMVMAAMISRGETKILNADALYRAHPRFAQNLKKLGAKIREV